MVTFSVNEPMTSKNANNSSTAKFESNKVVAKLRTGRFSPCFLFSKQKNRKIESDDHLPENVPTPRNFNVTKMAVRDCSVQCVMGNTGSLSTYIGRLVVVFNSGKRIGRDVTD